MAGHSGAEGIELESIRVDAGSQAARLAPGEQESDREAGQDRIFTLRDFAGASKIMFGGRLVCGPRGGSLHWTLILVMIPGVIWLAFLSPGYWRQVSPAVPLVEVLLLLANLLFLFLCATTDPGVLPREPRREPRSLAQAPILPTLQSFDVLGEPYRLKFCETCNIYRSPRSSHCHFCDSCVLDMDHHCPWVGTCIGRRNYRHFCAFLWLSISHALFVLASAVLHVVVMKRALGEDSVQLPEDITRWPLAWALAVYCVFILVSVGTLGGFHAFLLCKNQTTREFIKSSVPPGKGAGCSRCREVFCTATPSYLEMIGRKGGASARQLRHTFLPLLVLPCDPPLVRAIQGSPDVHAARRNAGGESSSSDDEGQGALRAASAAALSAAARGTSSSGSSGAYVAAPAAGARGEAGGSAGARVVAELGESAGPEAGGAGAGVVAAQPSAENQHGHAAPGPAAAPPPRQGRGLVQGEGERGAGAHGSCVLVGVAGGPEGGGPAAPGGSEGARRGYSAAVTPNRHRRPAPPAQLHPGTAAPGGAQDAGRTGYKSGEAADGPEAVWSACDRAHGADLGWHGPAPEEPPAALTHANGYAAQGTIPVRGT